MMTRFAAFYRAMLAVLAAGMVWSMCLWAWAADPPTAAGAPAGATNAVAAVAAPTTNAAPFRLVAREHLTLGLDRIPFLRNETAFGIALWEYIASFVFLFAAFYASKALDFLARVWLRKWAERSASRADDLLLELANGPVKVVAFVVFLHIGLSVFDWPPMVERWLSNGLKMVVAFSLTYALLKVIDLGVGAWGKRNAKEDEDDFNKQLGPILRKATKALVIVVATLVTLDNVGVNITGLVASLSIGGLALGLAAQDTVANLFGAVAVLVDKPFKVGDQVRFDGVEGTVESIGLRSTRVRHVEGHLITVPNKTMGNATVTNLTLRPAIRTALVFGLTCDTSPEGMEKAVALLREIYERHPKTKSVTVAFKDFGASSLNIQVVHLWSGTDNAEYLSGQQAFNLEIMRRLAAEKLELAFPTQTLLVRQG